MDDPAASRACFTALSDSSVWLAMSPLPKAPVLRSIGGKPETKTKPLALITGDKGTPALRMLSEMTGTSTTVRSIGVLLWWLRLRAMVGEHIGDGRGDALAGRDVQELVGAMGVRMRPQHAGDDELRPRKFRAEHRHEGNAAALAHERRRRTEGSVGGMSQRSLEPGRQRRGVPAGRGVVRLEAHRGAIRWFFFQKLLHGRVGRR